MDRNSFIFHSMWWDLLKELPDADRGRLIKAICSYVFEDEEMELPPMEKAIFAMIKKKLDADHETWLQTKEYRTEAGKKGADARWSKSKMANDGKVKQSMANASLDKQSMANDGKAWQPMAKMPVTVTVTDTVTDTVTVTDTDTEKPKEKEHKSAYGEFKHVRLTDPEYQKLCKDFGDMETHKAIKYLDEYIEDKGYKSKSHNMALRRWVFDAVKERERKKPQEKPKGVDAWAEALRRVEERSAQ